MSLKSSISSHLNLGEDLAPTLRVFCPLLLVNSVMQVYYIFGSILTGYKLSPGTIGWLISSMFVAAMLIRPAGTWALERFGIRAPLVAASAVSLGEYAKISDRLLSQYSNLEAM